MVGRFFNKMVVACFFAIYAICLVPAAAFCQSDEVDSLQKLINARKFNEELNKNNNPSLTDTNRVLTNINLRGIQKTPFLTVQQALKGKAPGLLFNEGSGEPGTEQFMFIRGLSTPLFSKRDVYFSQPVVYLNGVPLAQDNGLTYAIQRYDFNKLGSATNFLANLDLRNIESIEVLKSPADIATLGPLANNGAVWINTKNPSSGLTKFNFETYYGILQKPDIYETNAQYEKTFRQKYYDAYATPEQTLNQPLYMSNTNDPFYYGTSDWSNIYYKARPVYYVGFGLVGGSDRANFLFNSSVTKDQNFDATSLDRYNLLFGINMSPAKWLTLSSNINATRTNRVRNRNFSDRFAETRFVPNLSNPIPPNSEAYRLFLDKYRGSVDDNNNTGVIGRLEARATFGDLNIKSQLAYDYEESVRDVFWGRQLMDNNNFASYFFGFNQRFSLRNTVSYDIRLNENKHKIILEAGQSFTNDFIKYDYVLSYNTPNDFIKIKQIKKNNSNLFYNPYGIFGYPFSDNIKVNLLSFYGRLGYNFKEILELNGVVRYDGYSNYNADNRWLLTPVATAKLNVHEFVDTRRVFSTFAIKGSWGIFGKLTQDNMFSIGPQYRVDLGYPDEPFIGSYVGLVGLSQPYSTGLLYNYYNWPYSERLNVGMELGVAQDRFSFGVDYYSYKDKNMIVPIETPAEKGFSHKYVQGMTVLNNGVDLSAAATVIAAKDYRWSLFGNFSWNKNKLLQLPYGLSDVVFADRKIEIGKPVDSYWLYENVGKIESEGQIPAGLTFTGTIPFSAGDPLWKDNNRDGVIDSRDKVVKGNFMPVYTGGFGSNLNYRNIYFDFEFYYALGHQLLNNLSANKLDFINADLSENIVNMKEITFWQKTFDQNDYPVYNPWSSVVPYRLDQDLFLEDADFLKLRYVSVGYDFAKTKLFKEGKLSKALLYVTGTNLYTFSSYKDGDPELVDYRGIYSGRSLPIPKSFIVGLKLNF